MGWDEAPTCASSSHDIWQKQDVSLPLILTFFQLLYHFVIILGCSEHCIQVQLATVNMLEQLLQLPEN